jgi:hypothetical protein
MIKTPFSKSNLLKSGMYLLYGNGRQFVARFKWNGPFTMTQFKKELIRNHNVEDYFSALSQGKAPLEILREKNPSWYEATKATWMTKF